MEQGAGAPPMVAVAWSGGRDSTALLHAVALAAKSLGQLQVLALHVHHGLQPGADAWLLHCEELAARWRQEGLPLQLAHCRVRLQLRPGSSLEAEARQARYAALREMALAHGAQEVWLAHHRRDQAETFLLQALRGAGVAGLSAMPQEIEREGIRWVRPWLDWPRETVEAYVARHGLRYIDDDSNADNRWARNRLRLDVWPALATAFPGAETALAGSARWAQEAQACLADLAELDLAALRGEQGLDTTGLLRLPRHRARNALRRWFHCMAGRPLPATLCERLMEELPRGGVGQWPVPRGHLGLYRGWLSWSTSTGSRTVAPQGSRTEAGRTLLSLDRPGDYRPVGWAGVLRVAFVPERGVKPSRLEAVHVAARQGGEQFQLSPARPARSLKKQYQALGVPAWQRGGPLVWQGEQLLYVPGLGIDARVWAPPGEPQLMLSWMPDEN